MWFCLSVLSNKKLLSNYTRIGPFQKKKPHKLTDSPHGHKKTIPKDGF